MELARKALLGVGRFGMGFVTFSGSGGLGRGGGERHQDSSRRTGKIIGCRVDEESQEHALC
jgi:hypothetical protein